MPTPPKATAMEGDAVPQPERQARRQDAGDDWGGPYLNLAVFCSEARQDEDGWSFVGVHGGSVSNGAPDSYAEPVLAVTLTGGRRRGAITLDIFATFPDGVRRRVTGPDRLTFDGPAFGHTLAARIRISAHSEGVIWFDVMIDDRLMTRLPFQIQHEIPG